MFGDASWRGLVTGVIISCTLGLMAAPFSAMMNAYIHHHPVMRLLMGILGGSFIGVGLWAFIVISVMLAAQNTFNDMKKTLIQLGYAASVGGVLSLITTIYALCFMRERHYFGLFPLMNFEIAVPAPPTKFAEWPLFIVKSIGQIFALIFSMFLELKDEKAYSEHLERLFEGTTGPFVNEAFNLEARKAAAIPGTEANENKWKNVMDSLQADNANPYKLHLVNSSAPVAPAPNVAPAAPSPNVAKPAPVAPSPNVASAPVAPSPNVASASVAPAPASSA